MNTQRGSSIFSWVNYMNQICVRYWFYETGLQNLNADIKLKIVQSQCDYNEILLI